MSSDPMHRDGAPLSPAEPELSVVIPVSERCDDVEEIFHAYHAAIASRHADAEYVYVLDGDFPAALRALKRLQGNGYRVRIVRMSRRFGEATAMTMGVENARAETILFLPAYYQVEPASLVTLLEQPRADVLVVRRWPRRDSRFNRLGTALFHRLLRAVTGYDYRDVGCGVRLVRRRVFREVALYGAQHRFLPILAAERGFQVREMHLPQSDRDRRVRLYRPGAYLFRVMDLLAVFFVVRFMKRPLRFFGLVGSAMILIGGAVLAVVILQRLVLGTGLAERPALLLGALLLVLGVQLFAFGLLGELITFIHGRETKEYAVEETVNLDAPADVADEREIAAQTGAGGLSERPGGHDLHRVSST